MLYAVIGAVYYVIGLVPVLWLIREHNLDGDDIYLVMGFYIVSAVFWPVALPICLAAAMAVGAWKLLDHYGINKSNKE